MKTIAALAVTAMVLVDAFGPRSSVGGPMTDLMILFVVMLAVGIYEAWSNQRGTLGWIASIITSLVAGLVAVSLTGTAMEALLTLLHFQGRLADSQWSLIVSAGMAMLTVLGCWIALRLLDRTTRLFAH